MKNDFGAIQYCLMDKKSITEFKRKNISIKLFKEKDLKENSDNIIIKEINEIFDIIIC